MPAQTADWMEQQLNLKLPSLIKQYLSEFPFDEDSPIVREGMVYPPQRIAKVTTDFRTFGFFDQKWPTNFLVTGGDGLGNEFFLNVESDEAKVFLADHEASCNADNLKFAQSDESLDLWIKQMRSTEDWFRAREAEQSD